MKGRHWVFRASRQRKQRFRLWAVDDVKAVEGLRAYYSGSLNPPPKFLAPCYETRKNNPTGDVPSYTNSP